MMALGITNCAIQQAIIVELSSNHTERGDTEIEGHRRRVSAGDDGRRTQDARGDDRELLMDILKFGPDVEVLAPPALRERVAEALTAARRRYRKVPLALRERG